MNNAKRGLLVAKRAEARGGLNIFIADCEAPRRASPVDEMLGRMRNRTAKAKDLRVLSDAEVDELLEVDTP